MKTITSLIHLMHHWRCRYSARRELRTVKILVKRQSLITKILLVALMAMISSSALAQNARKPGGFGRAEYIEVEPNVRLHITDLGEGKPVVLIHGWPLSAAMFEYQYAALLEKGYRVIGITLRGFGLSDKPAGAYNYDVFADDIKVVLDKLNIQNATIGGFSMGGATVIHYVARHGAAHVSKLALFGAAAPIWTRRDDFPYGLWTKADVTRLIELNNANRPQLMQTFGGIFTANDTSVSAGHASWLGNIQAQASPYAMAKVLATLRDTDLREAMRKIKIPTLILHGKADKICSYDLAEQMHAMVPHSKLVPFEKSGHALFIEELDKFNKELIDFVD